jgi:hypothetical protein
MQTAVKIWDHFVILFVHFTVAFYRFEGFIHPLITGRIESLATEKTWTGGRVAPHQ